MNKEQKKTAMQLMVRSLSNRKITSVWYEGVSDFKEGYHSVFKAIYMEFDQNQVYCFKGGDELGLKAGYGMTLKEMKFWERRQKEIKHLEDATDQFQQWIDQPLKQVKIDWNYKYRSGMFAATHLQSGDYPQGIDFIFDGLPSLFLTVTRIFESGQVLTATKSLTIYFNGDVKKDNFES